jgi:hypothetical protein
MRMPILRKIPTGDEGRFGRTKTNIGWVGNFSIKSWRGATGTLFELDDFDKSFTKDAKIKKGCKLFRYETDSMHGFYKPLIAINPERGLIYFLADYEVDEPVFDTKSCKATYVNLMENIS